MTEFSSSRYFLAFFVLNLYLKIMDADPNLLAFSFKNFGNESNFESQLALFGDAKVANDNKSVQITGSRVSSASGGLICKKPINLSRNMVSFSNYFVFSMSGENGDGLAFVMISYKSPLNFSDGGSMGLLVDKKLKFLAVEFFYNHVVLDIETIVTVKVNDNISSVNLMLNSGEKLQAWIDYQTNGKIFEVRLSKLGESKPVVALLSYPIDLSRMWKYENVTVGLLSSSSGNSSRKSVIYSWNFNSRNTHTPLWMHSEPLDPEGYLEKREKIKVSKRSECVLRILGALIFGSGCGAIGAFAVMYLWSLFRRELPVVPEEFATQSKEFEYDKFDVCFDKTLKDGTKK